MILRLLSVLCFALLAAVAAGPAPAACAGHDLAETLSAADRARLEAAVASDPFAVGNHWIARRGTTTITLIGTFHLYDPRLDAIVDRLWRAVAGVDTLYLEATDNEKRQMTETIGRDPARLLLTTGPTLPEALPAQDWERLSAELSARGIPAFMGAKFRPWYVSILLALPACLTEGGKAPAEGLDRMLIERAAAAGLPMQALEPWDTALRLFDDVPFEEQLDMLRTSLSLAARAEDSLATMQIAYFAEEHRRIWELSRLVAETAPTADPAAMAADFAEMEAALLTRRNEAWIDLLLPAAQGRQVAVAVGAAHLSGDRGLLALLQANGFTLERQPF